MPQDGPGLARIVIGIVAEEDDLAAELRLQPAGGLDFGDEKALGKNPHGCWPKQMTGAVLMRVRRGRRF